MRKKITVILFFLSGISLSQNNSDENAPILKLESNVIDYGTIPKGSEKYREVNFTNTGKSPLFISDVKSSCGCLAPGHPKKFIQPGESGIIFVRYDTDRIGKINKSITIYSNSKNNSDYLFEVRDENGKKKKVFPAESTIHVSVIGLVK